MNILNHMEDSSKRISNIPYNQNPSVININFYFILLPICCNLRNHQRYFAMFLNNSSPFCESEFYNIVACVASAGREPRVVLALGVQTMERDG